MSSKERAARLGVLLGAATLALLATALASDAGTYADLPTVRSGDAAAIALDPNDPVPQIGYRYRHCHECWRERGYRDRRREAYERGRHAHPWRGRWPGPDRNTAIVDCSGRNPHAFRSVSEAAAFTPPNGRILIVPPDPGMTCVETVQVLGPVTIASAGPTPAVIQAPPHQPCLIADIPLGDRLVVDNVKLIARGRDEPCVQVQAGDVAMHHVHVDSRNTEWAFDVGESGSLTLADSRIETDGSGVRAVRAQIDIDNVEIDVEEGEDGTGLALDRTDGAVADSRIIGAHYGAVVSSGPHGLALMRTRIFKADTALAITGGEQGQVHAKLLELQDNRAGVVVAPRADAVLDGFTISDTGGVAVALIGGRAVLTASHIAGAAVGVALGAHSDWHPDFWDRLFHRAPPPRPAPGGEGIVGRSAEVTGNEIGHVGFGIDLSNGGPALIAGNRIVAHECFRGEGFHIVRHDNSCDD